MDGKRSTRGKQIGIYWGKCIRSFLNERQWSKLISSLIIVLIISIQNAKKRGGVWIVLSCLVFLAEAALCLFPEKLLPWRSFAIDYGLCGVLLPVLIYAGRNRTEKLLAAAAGLLALSLSMSSLQWWCLLSLPLLALYSGERGRLRLKYLFYIYYPLHLIVLEGIRLLRR